MRFFVALTALLATNVVLSVIVIWWAIVSDGPPVGPTLLMVVVILNHWLFKEMDRRLREEWRR